MTSLRRYNPHVYLTIYRKIGYLVYICFLLNVPTFTAALESTIASHVFKRLARSEITHLKQYLHQVEDVGKRSFTPYQTKLIVTHLDRGEIYRQAKPKLDLSRKYFQRRKIMITADWSYHRQEKMPNLAPILDEQENHEGAWDLHHLIFLRLNGVNEWWNVMPIPRKDHHSIIHGKDQPGEILHQLLTERFPSLSDDPL